MRSMLLKYRCLHCLWNETTSDLHCRTKSVFHLCSPVICVCWGPHTHAALYVLVLPYLQRKTDAGKCQRFTSLTASQVAVSIETGKVCTVSPFICVNEPYHNTPQLVWVDRRRLQEPFHSVAQCLHITAFRRQRQLLPQSFFFFFVLLGSGGKLMPNIFLLQLPIAEVHWYACVFLFLWLKIEMFSVFQIKLLFCTDKETTLWPLNNTFKRKASIIVPRHLKVQYLIPI